MSHESLMNILENGTSIIPFYYEDIIVAIFAMRQLILE
jgi:hypothetical protein